MAALFISHSSKDDDLAKALEAWLRARGFTDLFVDHSNIVAGDRWAQALRNAAASCRVVVCIVTERWLASDECFAEFKAAGYMGKRIIPLLALQADKERSGERMSKVLAEDQGLDLGRCLLPDGMLDLGRDPDLERRLEMGLRAAGALARVGLDPEAFAINRDLRPTPFPGLASFGDDDADAALFYGRSREIAETLNELRQVRAAGDLRPLVILGASGAGKSSLLKAGVIPRLRREAPAWVPLRAFRPGTDPLLNFADALSRTMAEFSRVEAHGIIRDRLLDAWSKAERDAQGLTPSGRASLQAALALEACRMRDAAHRETAKILVSVDQAEELARAEGDSADALSDYLQAALASGPDGWQLAFTIRTDSFAELQGHRRFQNLKARAYDLRAIPVFRFDSVVEAPAQRYGVRVEDALVYALMEDAPKEDALPLLAFSLQRLWRQYAASGSLTKEYYERMGGLRGIIEDAAERALHGLKPADEATPPAGPPPKRQIDLAASTFVPALAQINDQGVAIRRVAAWSSFSDEQRDLLARFDQWRLVVRRAAETDGGTVEVAHEALFREWARLKGWFEPERARLEALRLLQADALAWDRNGRDPGFINHRNRRLADTVTLSEIEAYRKRLDSSDFDYLAACQQAERSTLRRRRRLQATFGVLLAGMMAVVVGWIEQDFIAEQVNWHWRMKPYAAANIWPYLLTANAEQQLKPLQTFRECARDCPEMIVIPSGEFMMGSPSTDPDYSPAEQPRHRVVIRNAFAVSKFLVTFADWDACVSVGWCQNAVDAGMGRGTKPVVNVSAEDAQRYVAWLAKLTGQPYRLLSEAEWEYAARAGTDTAYYWGDGVGVGNANCYGCFSAWDNKQTSPVGSFKPNAFGLYDMAGNVWQWVEDCFNATYDGAPDDGRAWITGDCSRRVVRGGSWNFFSSSVRSAYRGRNAARIRLGGLGFRVARTLAR